MYSKNASSWLKHLDFMIIDLIALELSFLMAYYIRHRDFFRDDGGIYREVGIIFVLIHLIIVFFNESYTGILRRGYYKEAVAIVKHSTMVNILVSLYLYLQKEGAEFSRTTFLLTWGIFIVLGYLLRILWKYVLVRKYYALRRRKMLVFTSEKEAKTVIKKLKESKFEGFELEGVVLFGEKKQYKDAKEIEGIKIVADETDVLEYIGDKWIDQIFVDLEKELPLPQKILNQCVEAGIAVHLSLKGTSEIEAQKQVVEQIGGQSVLTNSINIATSKQILMKRTLDIVGGLVGCILTVCLVIVIGPIIYIKSPGPIFFSQERIGKNGRRFKIHKFRSMYMDAEERKKELLKENKIDGGLMFKMDDDPRIIKGIGQFIRNHSLDEFPQFWNVLKGDMSLVGTRPPTVDEWQQYSFYHRSRMAIKPGITGMWQVSGRSNITDFEEVVKLDRKYITSWSTGLDLRILLKTVLVVFAGDGAM